MKWLLFKLSLLDQTSKFNLSSTPIYVCLSSTPHFNFQDLVSADLLMCALFNFFFTFSFLLIQFRACDRCGYSRLWRLVGSSSCGDNRPACRGTSTISANLGGIACQEEAELGEFE